MLKTVSSITNAIGALNFKGTWDANANSPALASSVGTKGDYYVVGTAGSTNLNGISNWGVGDWATFNGSVWQRVEGGADLNGVNLSVSGTSTLSGLTASTALALNASKELVSVTNTGTGDNVLATSPTLVTPALGTPASGVVTNLTGTASININGTVGATTANTGAFTTLAASGTTTLSGLTASTALALDASKNVVSVTNTGTGNNVLATSPALVTPAVTTGVNGAMTIVQKSSGAWSANDYCEIQMGVVGNRGGIRCTQTESSASSFATSLSFWTTNTSNALVNRMQIDAAGALILVGSTAQKATGTTWSNPSDQRLKDNIRDYNKGTAELMQIRVREWEYNGKGGTVEGTKGLGVVADEAMLVLPDTVDNYEAKLNTDDEVVTEIKKFDATEITWLLVKTVQEQQAIIADLTARVAALESK
jgi:hypothetical protein